MNHTDNVTRYSKITQIQSLLDKKMTAINRAGIMVFLKKELPYGTQFRLEGQDSEGLITIYFSKKKGLSFVDSSKNSTSVKVLSLLQDAVAAESQTKQERSLDAWIGTDESGKGDFFGPLVVAGFYMTRAMEEEVRGLGVADSKRLASKKIGEIARTLRRTYPDHIAVVAPSNLKYNQLYASFKNLNKLLAWGHARVIDNLVTTWQREKGITINHIVSDKFGDEALIKNALQSMKKLRIIQRPRGESNTAVAAASIIARDTFENRIKKLEKEYGQTIPLGAGAPVLAAAKAFVKKRGKEELVNLAKTHFKTYTQL